MIAYLGVNEPVPQLLQRHWYIRLVVCIKTEVDIQIPGDKISHCVCVRHASLRRRAVTTKCNSLARSWLNTKMSTPQRLQEHRTTSVCSPVASTLASRASIVSRQTFHDGTEQASTFGPIPLLPEANQAVQRLPGNDSITARPSTTGVQIIDRTDGFDKHDDDGDDDEEEEDEGGEDVEGELAVQQGHDGSAPLRDIDYYAQEDTLTDSDISSVASEDEYNIPDVIREVERDAENDHGQNLNASTPLQLNERYKSFLRALCTATTTEAADQHIRNGLPYAIRVAKSLTLDQDMRENEPFDKYAFALVVHVWQVVCLRLLHGVDPPEDPSESLITYSGAYF